MYNTLVENIELTIDNVHTWIKIKDDCAFEDIAKGWRDFFKDKYMEHVRKKDIVIQAGGYCGVFPRLFSDIFKLVYTFEPDPLNFYCLVQNCQKDNIIKAQGALGNNRSSVSLYRTHTYNKGMNVVREEINSFIPSYRIDDLNLSTCDLIQLDVEGYEYNILMGAQNTIKQYKPVITVEDTNHIIEKYLHDLGYQKKTTILRDTIFAI